MRLRCDWLLNDPNVDIIIAILVPQSLVDPVAVASTISNIAATTEKTVISCFMGDAMVAEPRRVLHKNNVPMVVYPESTGTIMGAMLRYAKWLAISEEKEALLDNIDSELVQKLLNEAKGQTSLGEFLTRPLLDAYGIQQIAGDFADSEIDAVTLANKIGYPVAMKIVSPDILHKSDVGGIRLNLQDAESVHFAYQKMMAEIEVKASKAHIEGILIEKMAPKGQEVIIGMRRDPGFGAMMMFGLGGIYVELFKDIAFRVAPLTRKDAFDMISATKAGTLLNGYRGQEKADINAVVDTILRLSKLAVDFPEINEIEINPLLVLPDGQGILALDGRVILS